MVIYGSSTGGVYVTETEFIKVWKERADIDGIIFGKGKAADEYEKMLDTTFSIDKFETKTHVSSVISGLILRFKKMLAVAQSSKEALSRKKYDAVIYSTPLLEIYAGIIGKMLHTDVYWHMPRPVRSRIEKWYYEALFGIFKINAVANSKNTRTSFSKYAMDVVYPGYSSTRVKRSNSSVDKKYRLSFDIDGGEIVFGIAARIQPVRAQHKVIMAAERILREGGQIRLLIAGSSTNSRYLKKCQEKVENKEKIIFIGEVKDMYEFYSSVDVYVNSINTSEGFGVSVAEALSLGVPVITKQGGGTDELVTHEKNGILIKGSTTDYYYLGMKKIISETNDYKLAARRHMSDMQFFNTREQANRFLDIISSKK